MSIFDTFSFSALWSPYFLAVLVLITIGYFYMMKLLQQKWGEAKSLTTKETLLFLLGVVLLYIMNGSPVDLLSHIMFSTHMAQMAVLYLIIPIIFIHGIPDWFWKKVLLQSKLTPIFRFLTKPLIALILFNGMFSFYHIPLIFDVVKTDIWLHGVASFVLFILSFFMWWPLMQTVPNEPKLSGLKKVGYLFADGVLLTPACALIIFSDVSIYLTYSDPNQWAEAMKLCLPSGISLAQMGITGPDLFNTLPILEDQQLGGVIMKIMQEIVFGFVLANIFFSWYRQEQEEEKQNQPLSLDPEYAE